ncbi:tetratricopeptide repeat protein [Streptomyces yaanensis]|uniref:Tetratricopeptide repeat protein n=1 Tax=Streptomyces yaanensis TaxID=1142239 RepID=A0ABV7SK45_9ACTN|nr:tetratricopeptide repeat protein [Streptomyces sp. CGMCC 4.7035]WNC00915.1 tetratricopeptide repeat protein [Streptomyces sp. CGMCC 4.7035]
MSPRTNESAPASGHDGGPEAEPPSPTLGAAETRPKEGTSDALEDIARASDALEDTARAEDARKHSARAADIRGTATPAADTREETARAGALDGSLASNAGEDGESADAPEENLTSTPPTPRAQVDRLDYGAGWLALLAEPHGDGLQPVDAPGADTASSSPEPNGEPQVMNTPTAATAASPEPADGSEPVDVPTDGTTPSPEQTGQTGHPETVAARAAAATSPRPADGGDERIVALRRFSASGRRWRGLQLALCVTSLAVALTAGAVVMGAVRDGGTTPVASTADGVSPALLASGDLDAGIRALQAHLRAQPRDHGSWATLGLAYVEQARTKGDPSRYPQAERALDRSLKLRPDNDAALAGRAALAAARHDFTGALKYADLALKQNPYSERALSSRIDALVELGRYDEASKAADLADSRHPGVPVFTRYAYVHELRGDVKTARRVLEQALDTATSRGDIAYVATALGQLAWNQGQYETALNHYARALAADDTYLPALEGRARAQAAQGDTADAIRGMEQIVDRYPLPQPLVELGELYEARGKEGDPARARDQYALVDAWVSLARANGVDADLDTALAAADHGDRTAALRAARAEWARRHTVHTADALAWALHVNGRDQEALPYARRATATGYRNASFLYHRGLIERANGHTKEARASLTSALKLNAGFSPLGAREARKALEAMKK